MKKPLRQKQLGEYHTNDGDVMYMKKVILWHPLMICFHIKKLLHPITIICVAPP